MAHFEEEEMRFWDDAAYSEYPQGRKEWSPSGFHIETNLVYLFSWIYIHVIELSGVTLNCCL